MLHQWCFKDRNPIFAWEGLHFSVSIFTDTNRYDLNPAKCLVKESEKEYSVVCTGLQWAGGQEDAAGQVQLVVHNVKGRFLFSLSADKDEAIRRAKIVLHEEGLGEIVARRRYSKPINEQGDIFRYPNGWDDLFTPLICVQKEQGVRYYRSLDQQVRPKSFLLQKVGDSAVVEMIFEEDAHQENHHLQVPDWEVGDAPSVASIFEEQRQFVEKAYHLIPWEQRKDVPAWAKEISLIVSLHGMHWSGHIFNDYAAMEKKLAWFSKRIDPHKVLVYIPGFDGRYYYKYPNYDPDPRMGGEGGLKHLIHYAHAQGFHVMPMFMINGAHPKTPGFEKWGTPSMYHSPNGYVRGVGSCDWDTSRSYELGCGIGLNPGAPLWQDYFVNEAVKQSTKFGFDGIFLDLAAIYINDPFFSTHEGTKAIIHRIHEKIPSLLISTEGWYDALSEVFPLSQCAGQVTDKGLEMVYHDTPYAPFFDTYNRCYGHLCLGDVATGSTGVFESGFNSAESSMPIRKGIIPTITVLDDTLDLAPKKAESIIKDAGVYNKKFILG